MNSSDLAHCVHESITTVCQRESSEEARKKEEEELADLSGNVEEDLLCPICHGMLFRPVRPLCKHQFCRFCLILWVEKCIKQMQEGMCPMCRSEVLLPETLEVDEELECRIITTYGLQAYQLRHKDMVKEKIERLVSDLESEHLKDIEERCSLQDLARAGILGTAFAGPVGAVTALGLMGVYAAYTSVMRMKREDRRKYGIIEDDAWIDIPKDCIRLTNLSLTKVSIEMYSHEAVFPLSNRSLEPGEVGLFSPNPSSWTEPAFLFRVILPGFLDKELASLPVAPNHGYLFCCTDMVVEEIGPLCPEGYTTGGHDFRGYDSSGWMTGIVEGEQPAERPAQRRLEITNDSLCTIRCSFYTTNNYFADHSIILESKETQQICLPNETHTATVQISITTDSYFTPDTDLCIVQMRAAFRYQILQSRIYNKEGLDESPAVQRQSVEDEDYYSIF